MDSTVKSVSEHVNGATLCSYLLERYYVRFELIDDADQCIYIVEYSTGQKCIRFVVNVKERGSNVDTVDSIYQCIGFKNSYKMDLEPEQFSVEFAICVDRTLQEKIFNGTSEFSQVARILDKEKIKVLCSDDNYDVSLKHWINSI